MTRSLHPSLRLLISAPAYWPATAFGGPIPVMRALATGLVEAGWSVDVVTTSLRSAGGAGSYRTRIELDAGSTVVYAATPVRYRWIGLTPTVPVHLERLPRPDVAHVFGLRDTVGATVATWCRVRGVPYVLEGLGMFRPKLHKVRLKRLLDATALRHVISGASLLVAVSAREREEYLAAGIDPARVTLRPNGFPPVAERPATSAPITAGVPADAQLILSVGRVAAGKGLELLVGMLAGLPDAHLVLVGPDDGHGTSREIRRLAAAAGLEMRVHLLGAKSPAEIEKLYAMANVLVLASQHESFGMVAAEAASAGLPVVVTDRCGVAELLRDSALVVRYDQDEIAAAVRRVLTEPGLADTLSRAGQATAKRYTWQAIVAEQERIYRRVLGGTLDARRR